MKIVLIQVGKTTVKTFSDIIDGYGERLKHYLPLDIITLRELRDAKALSEEQVKQREGEMILSVLQEGDNVILLDERGKEMRSIEMAAWMEKKLSTTPRRLVFVIGGPYGFSKDVYHRANDMLSLSKMTFSHQMVRMIFMEQLYRSMTILRGEAYHHE